MKKPRYTIIFIFLLGIVWAAPLPKPDRGSVPVSDLFDYGTMGPPATPEIVQAAEAGIKETLPRGPFEPTWDSIQRNYKTPKWFEDAKFGLFLHWGIYAVPAHHNEWYEKHMYADDLAWHTKKFGSPDKFGYKDFIPLFTQEQFDAEKWAELFKKAGARFVIPTAQHHDNFALWDSTVTRFNAKNMGPKRDLIGELAAAVRQSGLKFGVSNHGMENFTFINPSSDLEATLKQAGADLYDPAWKEFYNVADRSAGAMERFLTDWVYRNFELIDKYQPDILWFDNGVNLRVLDPLKLRVAAYYYNRALEWRKEVSISTKYIAFAPSNDDTKQVGSIIDFEKVGKRSPADVRTGPWMVDDSIGSTWGYTEGMKVSSSRRIIERLIDTVSKGGTYLLNLAPTADGSIPKDQQQVLLEIGTWLEVNGEAIYSTRAWKKFGEANWHFTQKGDVIYAIGKVASIEAVIKSINSTAGKVINVEKLGSGTSLKFKQTETELRVQLGEATQSPLPLTLKITGQF